MNNLQITTIDLAPDGDAFPKTECEKLLFLGLKKLDYPPVEPDPPDNPDKDAKPYEVQFVPNPRAWGNFPNTQPLTIKIPRAKAAMHLALRRETEAAYQLGSWELIDQLAAGVFGLQQYSQHRLQHTRGAGRGQKMIDELRERVPEDRRELFRTFEIVRDEIDAKEGRCLALLQSYAACRAIHEELPACDALTLEEARRYLSLAKTDDPYIRNVLADSYASHAQSLTGPEGRTLVRAIQSLAAPFRKLKNAQERYEASVPKVYSGKDALWLGLLGPPGALPVLVSKANEATKLLPSGVSERKQAEKQLAQASAEWQGRFTELAMRYPILFKIADKADQNEKIWTRDIVLALQDALEASTELAEVFNDDPEKVWRFPGLINRSIRRGFPVEGNFASRVASDQLMRENAMPFFARLNAGIQLFNTSLMLVPYPPVKVATVIAAVIGDAAELLESYFHTKEQRMGYRAAIDPAYALGPDASYTSSLIQAAFVALDVLPIPGAAKEWAEESKNAEKAARLRQTALRLAQ